jgi:predicted DNA binding protein
MLKVIVKTETPPWCLIRKYTQASMFFKQIWLDKDRKVKALVIFKTPKGNETIVVRDHRCKLADAILNSGAIVVSAEVRRQDILWVLACTSEEFKRLMENLDETNLRYELLYKSNFFEVCTDLSYKESEILRLALDLGYFENPKRVKLEDLAKRLGMSKATASDLIRRALKKIVMRFVFENGFNQ